MEYKMNLLLISSIINKFYYKQTTIFLISDKSLKFKFSILLLFTNNKILGEILIFALQII